MDHPIIVAIIFWAACLSGGCEAAFYGNVQREATVDVCRRYLAQYPQGDHASQVRDLLEKRYFERAKEADIPLGYRAYIRRYAKGRYVAASRRRLAELAGARSRSVADHRLVVERYRDQPAAAQARSRLASALSKEVLKSEDPAELSAFMSLYPGYPGSGAIESRLVQLLYQKLGDDPADLQLFIREHDGTLWAVKARRRLRTSLLGLFRRSPNGTLLAEFERHFPGDPELPTLRELNRLGELRAALLNLDLVELKRLHDLTASMVDGKSCNASATDCGLAGAVAAAEKVLKWCGRAPSRCDQLRQLCRQTDIHAAELSVSVLTQGIADPDLSQAWGAMASLSLVEKEVAGDILLELSGAPRLVSIWGGYHGLVGWLARKPLRYQRSWLRRRLERRERAGLDGETLQQRVFLQLLLGETAPGIKSARRLVGDPDRAISAAYLLIDVAKVPLGHQAANLEKAFRIRMEWLKSAFPSELDRDSRLVAELVERELWILDGLLKRASRPGRGGPKSLSALSTESGDLLALWQQKLARTYANFEKASAKSFEDPVNSHRQRRQQAFGLLSKAKSPVARLLLRGICLSEKSKGKPLFAECTAVLAQRF